ncbi:hypothetical protein Pfo_030792 [Paulownia fortunei]|nr:hypothetical protein Pfo_030792 [Paulownia fortunei]
MIFACQNIRGLNALEKQAAIIKLVHEHNIPVFCVIETHVNKVNQSHILRNIFANLRCIDNYSWNVLGRIWVCWNPMLIDVNCLSMTDQIIYCEVKILEHGTPFFASFVYGLNQVASRRELWNEIEKHAYVFANRPWILCGDFNVKSHMNELDNCINKSDLDYLKAIGLHFTWNSGVLVNSCWMDYFPLSQAEYLPFGISDHTPMIVSFLPDMPNRKIPFKFFDFWLQHKHFLDLVADIWSSDIKGVPMFRVCKKFKLVKIALKKLNKHEFSDISKRVNEAKSKLESI